LSNSLLSSQLEGGSKTFPQRILLRVPKAFPLNPVSQFSLS
jgi:hypothetical protein